MPLILIETKSLLSPNDPRNGALEVKPKFVKPSQICMETLVKQTWHKIERTPRGLGVKPPNDVSPMSLKHAGQEGSEGFVGHVVKLHQTIVMAMVRKVQHPIM